MWKECVAEHVTQQPGFIIAATKSIEFLSMPFEICSTGEVYSYANSHNFLAKPSCRACHPQMAIVHSYCNGSVNSKADLTELPWLGYADETMS